MTPNVQFMLRAIYELKRDYGIPATLIQVIHEETDSAKGKRTVERKILQLRKIVPFPQNAMRKFWYDIGYLRANSNFTYGGEVEVKSRQIFVQRKDLGKIKLTIRDFFIVEGIRYQVEKLEDLDFNLGYFVSLKSSDGMPASAVIEVKAYSTLQVSGGCTNA